MKLIAEKRSKTDKYDVLRFVRNNGTCTDALMPRQGILPHDLVHFVVESALPLRHGFLSLLARGADAQFVMESVHDHANQHVETEAVQAEAIVEGLQAAMVRRIRRGSISGWRSSSLQRPQQTAVRLQQASARPQSRALRPRPRPRPAPAMAQRALLQHPVPRIQPAAGLGRTAGKNPVISQKMRSPQPDLRFRLGGGINHSDLFQQVEKSSRGYQHT